MLIALDTKIIIFNKTKTIFVALNGVLWNKIKYICMHENIFISAHFSFLFSLTMY